jgi:hypothetical protein
MTKQRRSDNDRFGKSPGSGKDVVEKGGKEPPQAAAPPAPQDRIPDPPSTSGGGDAE